MGLKQKTLEQPNLNYLELELGNHLLGNPKALKHFMSEHGYLYLKGAIEQKMIEKVRQDIHLTCVNHGIIKNTSDKSFITPETLEIFEKDTPAWKAFYKDILCLHSFNSIPTDNTLYKTMTTFFGESVFHHSRVNARFFANIPFHFVSPPHMDFTWVGGTTNVWTCWIPIVEVVPLLGGLQLIDKSHKEGFSSKWRNDADGLIVPESSKWSTSSRFEIGDAVFFHSKTVHSGGGNFLKDRLRISIECRFQPVSEPVRQDTMEPHWKDLGLVTWEEIYAKWPADAPEKYYWHKLNLNIVPTTENAYNQDLRKRYLHNVIKLKSTKS